MTDRISIFIDPPYSEADCAGKNALQEKDRRVNFPVALRLERTLSIIYLQQVIRITPP
jgi:hypothetical protein